MARNWVVREPSMISANNRYMLFGLTAIIISIIGSVTYLAGNNIINGATVDSLFVLIIGALGGITAVHVTGNVVQQTNGHETTVTTHVPTATAEITTNTPVKLIQEPIDEKNTS